STRLLAEAWVQSARMAGIHFRGAKVARGGLRHSDRPDDVHTEVMGLVRTQSVKNAVIVPAGSKGGFVTPVLPGDPAEVGDAVKEQYRTFIRGLLDITDNLVDGELVRAPGMVVHDDADPYLVVAADKGTAKFSDIANDVAAEYDFWLDDAFASGGSNGYSHKDVGITARGAWECVRRHFREMGRDTQTEPLTAVGIGDMSGDVFGNGMLRSRQIRLVGAFDHRHIFVDPDPDAETSYVERERLAGLGRSSWDDYDRAVLSEGGFIVPRGQKEITITPQARAALGIADDVDVMDGESLIRAILSAPVDLLWNGGIGTYVKAPEERHAEVGDTANDAVRIDATDLRAKVLGEGGNLGLTQRARIRYALDGGRCNTDAIDNSGGVEMSDREVNLKILLNAAVSEGRLDRDGRNALLHELTDAVTEKVLNDNRSQSLAISLDSLRASADGYQDFQGFMTSMEQRGVFERATERLPTLETLVERDADGKSIVRPELAVLLAYSKLSLKQSLLESNAPDDPAMTRYLAGYFPERAVDVAEGDPMTSHRLRREIIATQLCNDMVDLMGAAFVHRVARDTGRPESDVARAWFAASTLAGGDELRARLTSLEGDVPSSVVYRWLLGLSRVLERTTRWILTNVSPDTPIADVVDQYLDGITTLRRDFRSIVVGEERELFERLTQEAGDIARRDDVAASLITLRFLDQLLGIIDVARETGADPLRAGRAFYLLSDTLELGWLRGAIQAAAGNDGWEQRAAHLLDDDVRGVHRRLTASVVSSAGANGDVASVVNEMIGRSARELASYRAIRAELKQEDRPTLAALIAAVREMEGLGQTA
ncbi:MAG: NAD-glutamate dehydrogenase domain-containing protein, partial [Longimicrobiales bacterium]